MGCSALARVQPAVTKSTSLNRLPFGTEEEAREFMNRALLPVDGFAASGPSSLSRQADLRMSMAKLSGTGWDPTEVGPRGSNQGGEIRMQLPPEVFCHVQLESATLHGCVLALFEQKDMSKSDAAKVEATIQGVLCFPPEVYVKTKRRSVFDSMDISRSARMQQKTSGGKQKVADAGQRNTVRPWRLKVEVRAVLEQAADLNAMEAHGEVESSDHYLPLLKVSCKNMQHGDAVGDSWFPYADILADLEEMLNIKLQNTLEDYNDNIWQSDAKTLRRSSKGSRL